MGQATNALACLAAIDCACTRGVSHSSAPPVVSTHPLNCLLCLVKMSSPVEAVTQQPCHGALDKVGRCKQRYAHQHTPGHHQCTAVGLLITVALTPHPLEANLRGRPPPPPPPSLVNLTKSCSWMEWHQSKELLACKGPWPCARHFSGLLCAGYSGLAMQSCLCKFALHGKWLCSCCLPCRPMQDAQERRPACLAACSS